MKVSDKLLVEVDELLTANQEELVLVEDAIVSVGCSGCGWGCAGIVGD